MSLSEFQITTQLEYIFREQPTSDYGVDAHVEIKRHGHPTGRLLGLQIKTGRSRFGDETNDGWKFRPKKKHIKYWLGHSLPLYVLLVDTKSQTIYWQELSESTLKRGPRGGIYVDVPRTQTLATAQTSWELAAERFELSASTAYEDNLAHLPPNTAADIATLAKDDAPAASLLAAYLALGRGCPELTVRTLLESSPEWLLRGQPGNALAILADYAHAHGLDAVAAEALAKAAALNPAKRYRWTRNAGLILLATDKDQARELLDASAAMAEAAGDPRLIVGYAILAHPDNSANPVLLKPGDDENLHSAVDDDLVLTFLARRAEFSGNLNAAVDLNQKALALTLKSAGVMEALSEALMRRAHSPLAQPEDRGRGIELAAAAVDQLHEWSGSTEQALDILLQSLISAGQFQQALDWALASPDGKALPQEAIRPTVQARAALSAAALNRQELASRIVASMLPGVDRDVAMMRTAPPGVHDAASWQALLDRLDESRPEALLQVVLRLSDLGVDRSTRLALMTERGIVRQYMQDVVVATAAAVVNLDQGLPALRLLAEVHELAAAKLVTILGEADRIDDAQAAAGAAYERFRNVEYAVQRARMLRHLNRGSEAKTTAQQALSDSTLDPIGKRVVNGLLARLALDDMAEVNPADRTQLLRLAERHLLECVSDVDGLQVDNLDVWQLAEVQLRLGSVTEAFDLLSRFDPPIKTADAARVWLSIVQRQQIIPDELFSRMLDLADKYADDVELSGALLATVIGRTRDKEDGPATPVDVRSTLQPELRKAAFESLDAHVKRHGDRSAFRVLEAPTTEALLVQMTNLMRRQNQPLVELLEMTRQGRVPLGLLAAASRRPYAATIAIRPLGYLLATAANDDDAALDESTVRLATNQDVVVDASALAVASQLAEYDKLRGQFRSLLMPTVSADDITLARRDLDGRSASSGFVVYDADSDSIVASEVDLEEHLGALRRLALIEEATPPLQLVPGVDMGPVSEIAAPAHQPWLAPIALALQRAIPLWSDDVAQRRLARHLGVAAFGTTAAQQARIDRRLGDETLNDDQVQAAFHERQQEVLDHLVNRIADAPVDVQTVIEQAATEAWDERLALITVGRPGWWASAPNPWVDLRTVLAEAQRVGEFATKWRYHAMWGAVRLTIDEPSRAATLLAAVAVLPINGEQEDTIVVQHLDVASAIAKQYGAHLPTDFITDAATLLVNAGLVPDAAEFVTQVRHRVDEAGSEHADSE